MAGQLKIKFDSFGHIAVEATGFTGTACEAATNEIIGNLAKITKETKTPEYFETGGQQTEQAGQVASRW